MLKSLATQNTLRTPISIARYTQLNICLMVLVDKNRNRQNTTVVEQKKMMNGCHHIFDDGFTMFGNHGHKSKFSSEINECVNVIHLLITCNTSRLFDFMVSVYVTGHIT